MKIKKVKAAFIPYYQNKILTCLSSNPLFGGPHFALCKGQIDKGETVEQAAIREAEEELGLRETNLAGPVKHLGNFSTFNYMLSVYFAEVKDPDAFNLPCWEIAETKWMTWEEFKEIGREQHRPIVNAFYQNLS
jgi:8-oxo-dGTP pyrophosphatase MutT (NUDIX family)